MAFCSYLPQIPIRVILTCQVSFLIALDVISENLKFKIFWGEDPPDPPKSLCSKCTGYYTPSSLCPPSKPKISILPPLGEFSKKNTGYTLQVLVHSLLLMGSHCYSPCTNATRSVTFDLASTGEYKDYQYSPCQCYQINQLGNHCCGPALVSLCSM